MGLEVSNPRPHGSQQCGTRVLYHIFRVFLSKSFHLRIWGFSDVHKSRLYIHKTRVFQNILEILCLIGLILFVSVIGGFCLKGYKVGCLQHLCVTFSFLIKKIQSCKGVCQHYWYRWKVQNKMMPNIVNGLDLVALVVSHTRSPSLYKFMKC